MRTAAIVLSILLVVTTGHLPTAEAKPHPTPLPHAHAHNDYEHDRPLFDALRQGFTSVEADVWLVDGELYLGHDRPDRSRTLRDTYLEPLRTRIARHRGAVYRGWDGTFQLLIDVKSGPGTWRVIEEQLSQYPQVFVSWHHGGQRPGPVRAVVSGNREFFTMLAAENAPHTIRWSGFDGRRHNAGWRVPNQLIPMISDNWSTMFTWRGEGPMPRIERWRLRQHVERAHSTGATVRFWGTPDVPGPARTRVWQELLAAGVDHLNTDDLTGLRAFLSQHPH